MEPDELIRFVSDGVDKAKSGDALAVYNALLPYHDRGEIPVRSHYAFGWILYYAMHQSASHAIDERKYMLARYLKLSVPKPHKLHSMVLTQAIRLQGDAREAAYAMRGRGEGQKAASFSLVRFVDLWNLANLRPGDWKRKEHEGKPLSSTVEKLISHYVDEVESRRGAVKPSAEFMEIIGRALAEYPESDGLLAQRATLHCMEGETEKASGLLRRAVLSAPGKFFLWSRLAALVDMNVSPRLHVALLYKALMAPGQESFKGKVRLALAEAWLKIGNFPFAAWEINMVKELYTANGWHLSPRFSAIEEKLPENVAPLSPEHAYEGVVAQADDYVYASLPEVAVVKTYHKEATDGPDRYGRMRRGRVAWRVTDGAGVNYWFNPGRHDIEENLPHGTSLLIKLHEGKIVKARLNPGPQN